MTKKLFSISFLALFFALNIMAQGRGKNIDENSPQVQEMRVEFFNQELQFSEAEAAAFWPIFDAHRSEIKSLREEKGKPRLELMSDAEAEQYLNDHFVREEKLLAIRKKFVSDLRGKIGLRKIALISQTEKKFKRELFKKIRENRGEQRRAERGGQNGRRF